MNNSEGVRGSRFLSESSESTDLGPWRNFTFTVNDTKYHIGDYDLTPPDAVTRFVGLGCAVAQNSDKPLRLDSVSLPDGRTVEHSLLIDPTNREGLTEELRSLLS